MATTKITSPDLFNLDSLNTELRLPSGTTAQRPTSPSAGEWRFNTSNNLLEMFDGSNWFSIQDKVIPPLPSDNFNTVLYNGTSATHAITNVGFAPDLVWTKDRNNAEQHQLHDTSRGATKALAPNLTNAEATRVDGLTSFDSNGFTLGTDGAGIINDSARGPYVAWCWKVNGGTTVSNTDGSIASTVQVNNKIGISIVQYTGTQANATVGHGLSVAPDLVITKGLNINAGWPTLVQADATTRFDGLRFNESGQNDAGNGAGFFQNTSPTQSVFYLGNSDESNRSGGATIAYCFHSVDGFSKFGKYTGNGSTDGPIINTGFEPAFLMIKCTSDSSTSWRIYDNKRNTSNPRNSFLKVNANDAEETVANQVNFLTNGFQLIGTNNNINGNGRTQIYIAFASDGSAAPVLADSFANKLWTGNDSTNVISGLGFQPSFVWIKRRNSSEDHALYDIVRGINQQLSSNTTAAQILNTAPNEGFSSFDTDGFTLGNNGGTNRAPNTYVGWSWKANSTPTINTDGTIQSVVSASQASGFSIVKYTGTGSNATIGHGLSSAPELVITKIISNVGNWTVGEFATLGTDGYLKLNTTDSKITATNVWNDTAPTSTVVNIGTSSATNTSSAEYISYCFTSISGFSKIGTYPGSASAVSVDTGFQASFVLIKRTDTGTTFWNIFDSARGGDKRLYPNSSNAETDETSDYITFDSDGFNVDVTSNSDLNQSGGTFLYMAFKENPTPMPLAGNMSFLVVAGGGGGGNRHGGGAGAGGLRTSYGGSSGGGSSAESDITLAAGTYTITIGGGGAGVAYNTTAGVNGTNSVLSGTGMTTITSDGGGGGGISINPNIAGSAGGSGGGGGSTSTGGSATANQGKDGGQGTGQTAPDYGGGGGGGATLIGNNGSGNGGGNGGNGLAVEITGSSVAYAGGGGGSSFANQSARGLGGTGGGGDGAANLTTGQSGTANLGGGGGGTTYDGGFSGAGGAGVIILRLLTSEYSSSTTGSPTVTTDGDYTVLTYTGSGTYVHS